MDGGRNERARAEWENAAAPGFAAAARREEDNALSVKVKSRDIRWDCGGRKRS